MSKHDTEDRGKVSGGGKTVCCVMLLWIYKVEGDEGSTVTEQEL